MRTIKFESAFDNFVHPSTYVNKLLFSGSTENGDGTTLQLWNIMTEEKIFEFGDITKDMPAITCIE